MHKPSLIVVIDGSSLLYRSFYGVKPLHTSAGIPTHALYGFMRTLKLIIEKFSPTHLVVTWDVDGPTHRHITYPLYKAHREKAPDDLRIQKEIIRAALETAGIAQIGITGYEADDVIYSLAIEYGPGNSLIVVTGDKDLHQLLTEHVTIYDPFKAKVITRESFTAEKGFAPTGLLLYHSLLGDSSDNIPGARGIGEKTAQKLVEEYHSYEELYGRLSSVKPIRVQTILSTHKSDVALSRELFTLTAVPGMPMLEGLRYTPEAWRTLVPLFKKYEITPFSPHNVHASTDGSNGKEQSPQSNSDIEETANGSPQRATPPPFTIVNTQETLARLSSLFAEKDVWAVDTETTGLAPFHDTIIGISLACSGDEGFYIPIDGPMLRESLTVLRPFLESTEHKKVLHNAKFDALFLVQLDITLRGVIFDTLIAASLLRNGSEKIGLKALSQRLLNEEMVTYEEMIGKHKEVSAVPLETIAAYAAHDATQTYKLYTLLEGQLRAAPTLATLYYEIEHPLIEVLTHMERRGIRLDTGAVAVMAERAKLLIAALEEKIGIVLEACGAHKTTINLNSPQQLEELLFTTLGLPPVKKSKTGRYSTDSEVLTELSKIHPVPRLIIEYREVNKLLTTYLEPLPHQISPRTGNIHTTFSQTGTATGRLASTDPNLQNIPVKLSPVGEMRAAFVPDPGSLFISADYSQIELRVLAHITQDRALLDAFIEGRDIHIQTAAEIFGIAQEDVTPAQRQVGKKINFSIIYGLTPYGLAQDLSISMGDAKSYIERYFAKYPAVRSWMEGIIEAAREVGYVTTLMGRRRYVPGLRDRNKTLVEAERRIAINTVIQGTAADILKQAMCTLAQHFSEKHIAGEILLQIHDELLIQAPIEHQEVIAHETRQILESVVDWEIPLTVSVSVGTTWAAVS